MTIEERLEKLEKELARVNRRNHTLLAVIIFGVVLLAAILLESRTTPEIGTTRTSESISEVEDVVRARSFVVIDENGKPRIILAMTENGPKLAFFDENQKYRIGLGEAKEVLGLNLSDENGESRALLFMDKDGPRLSLSDENEKIRATLGINKTITPDGKTINYPESSLLLYDPNENVIWTVPM